MHQHEIQRRHKNNSQSVMCVVDINTTACTNMSLWGALRGSKTDICSRLYTWKRRSASFRRQRTKKNQYEWCSGPVVARSSPYSNISLTLDSLWFAPRNELWARARQDDVEIWEARLRDKTKRASWDSNYIRRGRWVISATESDRSCYARDGKIPFFTNLSYTRHSQRDRNFYGCI